MRTRSSQLVSQARYTQRLRERGLVPVQVWVPSRIADDVKALDWREGTGLAVYEVDVVDLTSDGLVDYKMIVLAKDGDAALEVAGVQGGTVRRHEIREGLQLQMNEVNSI